MHQGCVPDHSLLRVDIGPRKSLSTGEALPPLNWVEEQMVSYYRVMRTVIIYRPSNKASPPGSRNQAFSGHVVAVPNTGPARLVEMFPCPLKELPEIMQVHVCVFTCLSMKNQGFSLNRNTFIGTQLGIGIYYNKIKYCNIIYYCISCPASSNSSKVPNIIILLIAYHNHT